MKRQSLLFGLLGAVVIGGGVWWWSANYQPAAKSKKVATNQATNQRTFPEVLPSTVTYKGQDGKNALELLKAGHQVDESGGFVNSIDGRSNTRTMFWLFYVNGQSASKGAADTMTTASDTLEWRFEQPKE